MQASDWLAPQEAIINTNNFLVAPIRDMDFGVLLWANGIVTLYYA